MLEWGRFGQQRLQSIRWKFPGAISCTERTFYATNHMALADEDAQKHSVSDNISLIRLLKLTSMQESARAHGPDQNAKEERRLLKGSRRAVRREFRQVQSLLSIRQMPFPIQP